MITTVVLKSWSEIETFYAVRGPRRAGGGFVMYEDFDAGRGNWLCSEVVRAAMDASIR